MTLYDEYKQFCNPYVRVRLDFMDKLINEKKWDKKKIVSAFCEVFKVKKRTAQKWVNMGMNWCGNESGNIKKVEVSELGNRGLVFEHL